MNVGRWIGGALGFVLGGGPLGIILGAILGGKVADAIDAKKQTNATENSSSSRARVTQDDIKVSLRVLIACLIKADGHIKKTELASVKRFLVRNYGEQGAKEALHMLKEILEQEINATAVAQQIAQHINYSTRLELLHFLLDLSFADSVFDTAEE